MKESLFYIIMLVVTCGLLAEDTLTAIHCRKREEELGLRQQVQLLLHVLMLILLIVLLVN